MKKYNLIPLLLTLWLAFMAWIGWSRYVSGFFSPVRYYGVIIISVAIIIALRYSLRRRARRRDQQP